MKRYTPPHVEWMVEGIMLEREDGAYVKYEDVIKEMIDFAVHLTSTYVDRETVENFIQGEL